MQNTLLMAPLKNLGKVTFIVLLVITSVLSSKNSVASHMMGMDLTYVCLGGNNYEFTINLYRDCSGIF